MGMIEAIQPRTEVNGRKSRFHNTCVVEKELIAMYHFFRLCGQQNTSLSGRYHTYLARVSDDAHFGYVMLDEWELMGVETKQTRRKLR